ncbi:MAG: galactose-1-phosphate uridylyltransferase [Pyrinomonadaceae bacterium]|nr:galactose-1-phosphate uridylyltransferase [Pyrinomonadaceae bacterium]
MTWEERWHPLREEWVIIAAHRQNRPWSGEILDAQLKAVPEYVEDCYLCPRNLRVSGKVNPDYERIFVFDNDHPSVAENAPESDVPILPIYKSKRANGIARVVCYSPKHNLTLTELEIGEIVELLKTWQSQYLDLGSREEIKHVLIFENKGEAVGVSNPHPHCQIYANNFVFKTIETEVEASQKHFAETGKILFQEIIEVERKDGRRIIAENDDAIAFLPYFARYAYEVFVAPKKTHPNISTLSEEELYDFAAVLKRVLIKFDNLWKVEFPYVMALHQSPTDGGDYAAFHFHIEFHPPLRKPNLLKYLAGPEIGGGNFLSDTSPEEKAAELKAQSEIHYKNK